MDPKEKKDTGKGPLCDPGLVSLLLAAGECDESAFAELSERYAPLIESVIAKYGPKLSREDREEVRQEALLAFFRAVRSYDPLYGDVSFGLYAKICVTNRVISVVRRLSSEPKPLPLPEYSAAYGADDPERAVIESESLRELRELIRSSLSDYENSVWWAYYAGIPMQTIAQENGKSRKSVENALFRIRRKLREILSGKKE